MNKGVCSKNLLEECPELGEKMVENEKLKYRLNILKRVCFWFFSFFNLKFSRLNKAMDWKKRRRQNYLLKKLQRELLNILKLWIMEILLLRSWTIFLRMSLKRLWNFFYFWGVVNVQKFDKNEKVMIIKVVFR